MKNIFPALALLIAGEIISNDAMAISDALKIKIASGSYSDEAIIRFISGATNGFDGSFDAWKLFSFNASVPNIYTKDSTSNQLAINAIPEFKESVVMDVYLKIGVAGTYSFTPSELGAFSPDVRITMKDVSTNQHYDLRCAGTYTFTLTVMALSSSARFKILFSFPASVHSTNATANNVSDGKITITKAGETTWSYSLKDSIGNIAASGLSVSSIENISGLSAKNYTLTIINNYLATETKTVAIKANPQILPVSLINFSASAESQNVRIEWSTASEINSDYFLVERSSNGEKFTSVGAVKASGNSSQNNYYNLTDDHPLSKHSYYRLKQVDFNGDVWYSKVEAVDFENEILISIFPNPASEILNINISGRKNQESLIIIRDALGKECYSMTLMPESDYKAIQISLQYKFSKGIYSIQVISAGNITEQKIIIN